MLDFLVVTTKAIKESWIIYPKFIIKNSEDLMIRGSDFYAIWDERNKRWSTSEQDALRLIDNELTSYYEAHKSSLPSNTKIHYLWDSENGMIDRWHKYCQKQMRDNFVMLDEKIIFSNMEIDKHDYASKSLPYPLQSGDYSAWEEMISFLYDPEEKRKIEWSIGSIVAGESKQIQKFVVIYGGPRTGKSTVLNVILQLFDGYCSVFDAKALGTASNQFALEAFRSNPLVAIQQDGDLSRIEDNTRLNSLVSHELMTVNEKFKSSYANRFKAFLFIGTNKPVKITDAKSGLLRRLIDITPTGKRLDLAAYNKLKKQISYQLGAIAWHCKEVYEDNPNLYDNYIPTAMLGASNDFYNFMLDSYYIFKQDNETNLKIAWEMYKRYVDEARIQYPLPMRAFKEELKNYFWNFQERYSNGDQRIRNYYSDFRVDKFDEPEEHKEVKIEYINFNKTESLFDIQYADCPAQYATEEGIPKTWWSRVRTKLKDIDTTKVHFVRVPENHIVVDFDLKDENGDKNLELNLRAAAKWPETYAELSKSGQGIHLHYIYTGDVSQLSRVYDENIEIKIFTGNSALRRKLTFCNDKEIRSIDSGLPLKEENKKMIDWEGVKNEKMLRTMIRRNLNKEYHSATKPSIDYIKALLDDAYSRGIEYDVSNLKNDIIGFAAKSSHNSSYCLKLIKDMKFSSDQDERDRMFKESIEDAPIVFFDCEVYPNLFLVVWKIMGSDEKVYWYNPTPMQIEKLLKFRLVGYNCRRYDNHVVYARLIGWNNEQIFNLSQKIINNQPGAFFGAAFNLSYTDIYDYTTTKQSLKMWEIQLGLLHDEMEMDFNQPVPEDKWQRVGEYCGHDVDATEAVFNATSAEFVARQILAKISGGTVNDTTNTLSAKMMFGNDRNPQSQFNYRNMGDASDKDNKPVLGNPSYTVFDHSGRPIFPGYLYDHGKSLYRGEAVSEGGQVYARPGVYFNVPVLDIASMHPSSIIAEELFGKIYTQKFKDLKQARIAIKRQEYDSAKKMLGGALVPYIEELESGKASFTHKDLAYALKIVINSVYGLTAAGFDNPFRDPRNIDNIVAKRGALFMINLRHEVEDRGYTVVHIKTDSIKLVDNSFNPRPLHDIIQFVMDYGRQYGYDFEHESTYERMALVNDAVYIAKYASKEACMDMHGYVPKNNQDYENEWTATGKQFQEPYVFKTLFTKEPLVFKDFAEVRSVSTALYLDENEFLPEGEHAYRFIGKVGEFIPLTNGSGGGILLREGKDKEGNRKLDSVSGSKGYRWMEAKMVQKSEKEDRINLDYYNDLASKAIEAIMKASLNDFMDFSFDDFVYSTREEVEQKRLPF